MKNLFLPLCVFIYFTGSAENIVWTGESQKISIGKQIEILKDAEGKLDINEVSSPMMAGKFKKSEKDVLSFDFSGSAYWLKFSLDNETADSLLLMLAQAILPTTDLYFRLDDGSWECYQAGYQVGLNNKEVYDQYQFFSLPHGNKQYFVRLISFSPPVPVYIENIRTYQIMASQRKITYGLYAGLLFGVIIYNLFWFFTQREFSFLHYASVVFLYLCLSGFVMDGYLLYFFHNANLTRFYTFLPGVTFANATLYVVLFLEIKKYAPSLYKPSLAVILYFFAYIFWHLLLPQHMVILLNQVNALISLSFILSLAIVAGYNRNRVGYYFALAYFIYLLIVVVEIIYIQTGSPHYIHGISHVNIAILIESALLTFLLSKRFAWNQAELQSSKEQTQKLLLKRTMENEQIVREQNIRLEETVKERSKELMHKNEILEKTISEKEVLLGEKEVMMYEIHHRIKNNLNNLAGMLTLQSQSITNEQAIKAITDSLSRVKAISLVHEKLYETGDLEEVQFNMFVQSLIEQLQSLYHEKSKGVSVSWNCPEAKVHVNKATVLGLIINELLTNSFKYAFNETGEGEIKIQLLTIHSAESEMPPEDQKFRLTYWDSGPGLTSNQFLKHASTFGLRIIKGLSKQMGAELTYSNGNGSEFAFIFTAESLGIEL